MPRVRVGPLPPWMPDRVLGPGLWNRDGAFAEAELDRDGAADVSARLRGLGFDGNAVTVDVQPRLKRTAVRDGRTRDARARRESTPGFDRHGTRLDEEGRWSLTPASLALEMGRAAVGRHVVELGCGAGGNTIGFARAGATVIAIERDARRLDLARHNARIYGVADRITFVHGTTAPDTGDVLFVDPPWGTDYDRVATPLMALPLIEEALSSSFTEVWAKVPPSTYGMQGAHVRPMFGAAQGDRYRVKFLWLRWRRTAAMESSSGHTPASPDA